MLEGEEWDFWAMFNLMTEELLGSLSLYSDRIGLPEGWEFDECLNLMILMNNAKVKHDKAKK